MLQHPGGTGAQTARLLGQLQRRPVVAGFCGMNDQATVAQEGGFRIMQHRAECRLRGIGIASEEGCLCRQQKCERRLLVPAFTEGGLGAGAMTFRLPPIARGDRDQSACEVAEPAQSVGFASPRKIARRCPDETGGELPAKP
jgi:hypothetical protein